MQTVLFTASTFSHIAAFHRPYLSAFRALGWRVHVACGGEARSIPEANEVISLPFQKRMTALSNFQAQHLLRQRMEETAYALVCTHTSLAAFFTRRAAAGLSRRPPIVNVAHGYLFHPGMPGWKQALLLSAERLTAGQTDLLLTMNAYDQEIARDKALGRRVEQIPGMGVDFSRFARPPLAETAALRKNYRLAPEDFVLIYAAEFSKRKNQEFLIRALPSLPPLCKLFLPGNGEQLSHCMALAERSNLGERVLFPGHVQEMGQLYALASAVVSSSRSEGLPFNIMEGMHCGLPVVASRVKGHVDLIEDGVTGLLYPPEDATAFVRQVSRLFSEPGFAGKLSTAAAKAMEPYAVASVLPGVMSRYLSVLE